MTNFSENIAFLKAKLILTELKAEKISCDNKYKKIFLINKIEEIVNGVIRKIAHDESPSFNTIYHSNWSNCYFNGTIKLKRETLKKRSIQFCKNNTRPRFVTIMFLLSKIHKLLLINKTTTRRELYYKNLELFESQQQVDEGMKDVSYILRAPPWDLGVLCTAKGIVAGPLELRLLCGEIIDCRKKEGVSIPSNICSIEGLSSTAEWVLIIEKDASFQQVIYSKLNLPHLDSCIIVTGKGFPDFCTRILICKLWEYLKIPIFALVDADPFGFEIMCVYRFGSVVGIPKIIKSESTSLHSNELACPAIRWLGIHPSDIRPLLLNSKKLSSKDIKKINSLLQRSYVKENNDFQRQLKILVDNNIKAEIEGVSNISVNYLMQIYVKLKVQLKEYY